MLSGQFYVPLIRAVDESLPAKVEVPLKSGKLLDTLDSGVQDSPQNSPRVIKAVAGPMSPSDVINKISPEIIYEISWFYDSTVYPLGAKISPRLDDVTNAGNGGSETVRGNPTE